MELTAIAQWLNTTFAGYDYAILQALHNLAEAAGGFFTPLCRAITLLGEKGILFLVLGIVLMLFPKTRKAGICMFGAVCCGALITNFWLKDFVARPRPLTVEPFRTWWQAAGAYAESEYSFPSGHVTAAMAGVTALVLAGKKPARWWAYLFVAAMGVGRHLVRAPLWFHAGCSSAIRPAFVLDDSSIRRFNNKFFKLKRSTYYAEDHCGYQHQP